MVLALLGSIKLSLAKRLHLDEARVGGLAAAMSLALIPSMLVAGMLLDECGSKWIFFLGCVLTASAVYGLALQSSYARALLSIVVLGAGAACINTSLIVLMPAAFFGMDANVTASLNLGTAFVILGALLTPALAELLFRSLDLRKALTIFASVVLLPCLIVPAVHWSEVRSLNGEASPSVLQQPRLWVAGLVFALYAPIEFCLSTWSTTYLIELGHRERRAAWALSGFWFLFVAGRLVIAYLEYRSAFPPGLDRWEGWVLVALALGVSVALGNVIGAADRRLAVWGILALGLLLGPIFPTLVGLLFTDVAEIPRAQWGTAYGTMFAIGSVGSFLLAPLIRVRARGQTVQRAFRIPLGLTLLLVAATLVLAVW
jgi:MFS family permease